MPCAVGNVTSVPPPSLPSRLRAPSSRPPVRPRCLGTSVDVAAATAVCVLGTAIIVTVAFLRP
eukprot:6116178-Lingulodinium_polyedra.AAC.1